jgi:hypothetical protein
MIAAEMSLDTILMIKIPEYDIYLTEIKQWAPIMSFIPVKVKYILNFINRHLHVIFLNKEDKTTIYEFIAQYNFIARSQNKNGATYPVANEAEKLLGNQLKITNRNKFIEKNKNNPFIVRNIHDKAIPKNTTSIMQPKKETYTIPKIFEVLSKQIESPDTGYIPSDEYKPLEDVNLS